MVNYLPIRSEFFFEVDAAVFELRNVVVVAWKEGSLLGSKDNNWLDIEDGILRLRI